MRVPRIGGKSPTHLTNYELSFTLSSFPRWVSYWCIGWQIYATKYCVEIEELFAQMMLLKFEIGVRMPGNKRYVNEYIEGCWQHVTALTSAIERYDSPPPWLEEKFVGYAQLQESILKERLAKIQYDIDAVETLSLILRGDRIEGVSVCCLVLNLALISSSSRSSYF
jgi:hypothetical protein